MTTTTVQQILPKDVMDTPAIFVNGFLIGTNPVYSRVTLGESSGAGDTLHPRFSFSMATADLKLLAQTILDSIKETEQQTVIAQSSSPVK